MPAPALIVDSLSDVPVDDHRTFSIEVTVTLPFNVIGARTFAAKERGRDSGMLIRAFGSDALPPLTVGDIVKVIAQRKGSTRGVPLLGTVGKKITRVSSGDLVFGSRGLGKLDDGIGLPVLLKGTITHAAKHSLSISDDRGEKEIEIVFPKKATVPKTAMGSMMEVRGILLAGADSLQLVIADGEAARILAPPKSKNAEDASLEAGGGSIKLATPPSKIPWLLGIGALVAAAVVAATWTIRKRNALEEDSWPENR